MTFHLQVHRFAAPLPMPRNSKSMCFTVQINIVYLASQIYLPSRFIAPLAAECLFCAAKLVLWSIHTVAAQK